MEAKRKYTGHSLLQSPAGTNVAVVKKGSGKVGTEVCGVGVGDVERRGWGGGVGLELVSGVYLYIAASDKADLVCQQVG